MIYAARAPVIPTRRASVRDRDRPDGDDMVEGRSLARPPAVT